MLNNILRNLPFGRPVRPARRPYGRMGSGVLLPALAYFGWKYRDQIKSFVQSKMGSRAGHGTTVSPSPSPSSTVPGTGF